MSSHHLLIFNGNKVTWFRFQILTKEEEASHKTSQENLILYFRFCHYILLKLKNNSTRSKLCPSSLLTPPWCCSQRKAGWAVPMSSNSRIHFPYPHICQGTAGSSTLCLSHSKHLSEPGRHRSARSLLLPQKMSDCWQRGKKQLLTRLGTAKAGGTLLLTVGHKLLEIFL